MVCRARMTPASMQHGLSCMRGPPDWMTSCADRSRSRKYRSMGERCRSCTRVGFHGPDVAESRTRGLRYSIVRLQSSRLIRGPPAPRSPAFVQPAGLAKPPPAQLPAAAQPSRLMPLAALLLALPGPQHRAARWRRLAPRGSNGPFGQPAAAPFNKTTRQPQVVADAARRRRGTRGPD